MKRLLGLLLLMMLSQSSLAMDGVSVASGIMALTNSTKQGGQGSQGSTILTETDITYHSDWWASGIFFQYDKEGSNETDMASGPRLELAYDPFYFEFGYALMMNRSFVDRAIAEQTGSGYLLGVGTRFAVGTGGAFLQFSYKYRIVSVKKQDGKALDEPITQVDGYPLFGIGYGF